ncbi:hypothetical protein MXB_2929 [Myxobolus squamalis]|nr:hypothetical protein MXB_2929 [Myxobolus squamalis]
MAIPFLPLRPFQLPIPDKLRMELWMGTRREIYGMNPGGIYHGAVQQGECTGSLVLPNSPIIVDKVRNCLCTSLFRSNSTELYEKFIFEYNKLIIGEIFIAYGFQKQLMIRVTILSDATISRIGVYQPTQSRDNQNMTTSCLTFWDDENLKLYKVKVDSITPNSLIVRALAINYDFLFQVKNSKKENVLYVYFTNLKSIKLSVELFDSNDQSLDHAVYQSSQNRDIFKFEYGTVKLDFAVQGLCVRSIYFKNIESTTRCNSNSVVYLGPVTASSRVCQVKTGYDHTQNTWAISIALVHIRSFNDYCIRAKGHYPQRSRQPEGFEKIQRLSSVQIQCCTGNIMSNPIC